MTRQPFDLREQSRWDKLFPKKSSPPGAGQVEPERGASPNSPTVLDKIFHRGWKATFAFAVVTTAAVYIGYISRTGFTHKIPVALITFIALYALLTSIICNLKA